ncbi:uncharacterized protein LOC121516530 isoform X2 [Cheilinus undulatus]|uniref:uncharacterized protein LOC121516530 isoform X2 n=1 Tax=Cheilinus undulatus TaxID=241271 RepID=UPI001BD2A487|nr:uncharacterized protein LOC121516530 isoform X2 [Cheilinus undulatus]
MIRKLAALSLLCALHLIQTAKLPEKISLTVVEVGGNVTLKCSNYGGGRFFYWYKQPVGFMVQKVVSGSSTQTSLTAEFNNQRFEVIQGKDHFLLSIRNASKEDEATYFCHTGTAYTQDFINGIFLAVKDVTKEKSVIVEQSPRKASIQSGHSVVFKCSLPSMNKETRKQCPGEHSVYWFRAGAGESHPAVIYSHSDRGDEEEKSCVYSLSKTIHNSSDAGTYYCAIVTCGQVLFGEGTTVETKSELYLIIIVLGVLLACCLTVNLVLLIRASHNRACEHCKEAKGASHHPGCDTTIVEQPTDLDGDTEAENYAALNFSARKVKNVKKTRESSQECVYSAVRRGKQHHPSQ